MSAFYLAMKIYKCFPCDYPPSFVLEKGKLLNVWEVVCKGCSSTLKIICHLVTFSVTQFVCVFRVDPPNQANQMLIP